MNKRNSVIILVLLTPIAFNAQNSVRDSLSFLTTGNGLIPPKEVLIDSVAFQVVADGKSWVDIKTDDKLFNSEVTADSLYGHIACKTVHPKYDTDFNLFTYGVIPASCDMLFSTFKENVTKCRDANSLSVKMLSCEFVGEVKSVEDVYYMVKHNIENGPHFRLDYKKEKKEGKKSFTFSVIDDGHKYMIAEPSEEQIAGSIQEDYLIYLLSYDIDGTEYSDYIFVHPTTLIVVPLGSFWSIM